MNTKETISGAISSSKVGRLFNNKKARIKVLGSRGLMSKREKNTTPSFTLSFSKEGNHVILQI